MSSEAIQPRSVPTSDCGANVTPDRRLAFEVASNVVLSAFFLQFAVANGRSWQQTMAFSSLLLMVKVSIDVVCYLTRRIPKDVSVSAYDWVIGIAGTYLVSMFRPADSAVNAALGTSLLMAGISLQILGMISLNRSIGMVAANRGVKTTGMYRLVRHPLYLSYTISFGGYLLCQASLWNLCVYAGAVVLWILRIFAEERLLLRSEEYRAYATHTRWRLLPGVF